MMTRSLSIGLLVVTAGWVFSTAATAQTSVQYGTGVEYSTGSYGSDSDTTIYEIPLTIRVRSGNWSFRARAPFASIDGPGGIVPGEDDGGQRRRGRGSGISGGDQPRDDEDDAPTVIGSINETGLSDISLSATYSFDLTKKSYLDLSSKVTLPTGDEEKDLGTGETDFLMSAEIGRSGDAGGVYLSGGYKVRGGETREDGARVVAGGYSRLKGGTLIGADVSWNEASRATSDDSAVVTAFTSFRMNDDIRLSLFAETGLTDNAPDFGAGIGLTWRTNFRRPLQRR